MTTADVITAGTEMITHAERRVQQRDDSYCHLWMVDHEGTTVLPCQCVNRSVRGMCLRVPLGYGVAEGQRYELRSHLPGQHPAPTFGVVGSRWATVIWTHVELDGQSDHLNVGVVLDEAETSLHWDA